jgi:hypothetical protein
MGDSLDPADLYDVIDIEGNALMIGGASVLWEKLIGGAGGGNVYSTANAHIGVGNSTTAVANNQTDLQAAAGASNQYRQQCSAVTHTDSATVAGAASTDFVATFATGNGNFAWQEWGVFNASTAGRMLNRKVESLGTKTSAATWQLTVTLGLTV